MTYEEQLKDPRWLALRETILDRDWHMCQECMRTKNLQVHHKRYHAGKMAWEYKNYDLITLCGRCHQIEHGIYQPGDFCTPIRQTRTIREVMIDLVTQLQKKFNG